MAYEIQNTLRNKSIIRLVGADTVSLNLSDFSTNTAIETVTAVKLARVMWSTGGTVTITRNATTVLSLYNSGDMNLQGAGYLVSNTSTGNVAITITTGGTCLVECIKEATYSPALG